MSKLIFLTNELLNPTFQHELGIPLDFVSFAHIKGKMYTHFRKHSTFVVTDQKLWGNNVVYGAIFLLHDYEFYIRILDAYNLCSLSTLRCNHKNDTHHRKTVSVTPISFHTISELEELKYKEREPLIMETYVGNTNHPKINQRLNKTNSYRVIDGINKNFKELIREEMK